MSSGVGLIMTSMKNEVGASIGPAVVVLAPVHLRHQARETDGVDLVDAARARVVADLRRVAQIASTLRTPSAWAPSIDSRPMTVQSRVEMWGSSRSPPALDRRRDHERAHAGAGGRVVVDVDEADLSGVLERFRHFEEAAARAAERRVGLDETTHSPSRSARARPVSRCSSPKAMISSRLVELERRLRLTLFLDSRLDRGDLGGRRAATAADETACAPRSRA